MSAMTWIPNIVATLGDHLWQSTLFVLAVAALTLAFRSNHARVRYALWLVASLKFLVPFGALIAVGQQFGWTRSFRVMRIDRVVSTTGDPFLPGIRLPFQPDQSTFDVRLPVPEAAASDVWLTMLPVLLGVVWVVGVVAMLTIWWMRSRRVARIAAAGVALEDGRELEMLRRVEATAGVKRPLPLVATDTSLEPGVFGIWRPILLWPRSIGGHLTDDQIEAIFAHEIAHVRRRDNLAAALQAIVQAVFWFHPLVWWISARLVDERERACDEDVIRLGNRPQVYAESILRTCQFYVEAPLVCVAGVTGSDLKRRIEQIMRNRPAQPLGFWRKGLLATAATLTLTVPIVFGAFNAPLEAQVKIARAEGARQIVFHRPSGPFRVTNFTVAELIRFGYELPDTHIVGAPDWTETERFDIALKWETDPGASGVQELVRNLLALHFGLTTHIEKRRFPAYALVRAGETLGPQLKPSGGNCTTAPDTGVLGVEPCDLRRQFDGFPNHIYATGVTMAEFVQGMNRDGLVRLDLPVVDRTGLTGRFDIEFGFLRGPHSGRDSLSNRLVNTILSGVGYPSLWDALEQQLGLKLEEQAAPVDVLVIDRIDQPRGN